MAITSMGDITANGLYVGSIANTTAYNESNLLKSGFVADASVKGSFSPMTKTVNFPAYNFASVVSQTLPDDGTGVTPNKGSFSFMPETVKNTIISVSYEELAVQTGVDGLAGFLSALGEHVGKVHAYDIETSLAAQAVEDGNTISTYAADEIGYDSIMGGATAAFGAKMRPADIAVVMHSTTYGKLLQDADYEFALLIFNRFI